MKKHMKFIGFIALLLLALGITEKDRFEYEVSMARFECERKYGDRAKFIEEDGIWNCKRPSTETEI